MYWLLLRRALLRRKVRLVLTELSLIVAFFLFVLLQGLNVAFQHAVTGDQENRLMVMNRNAGTGAGLPQWYRDRIDKIAGVSAVTPVVSLAVYYQDKKQHVEAFAIDPHTVFQLYPEWQTTLEQLQALQQRRNGAIVGIKTAQKYGWQIGQIVPLISERWLRRDGTATWPVEIVGFYRDVHTGLTDINVLVNTEYLQEARAQTNPSDVDLFIAGVTAGDSLSRVSAKIDDEFANSGAETDSETEHEFGMTALKRIGSLNLMVGYIVGAMFFALLFATSLTVSQSAQARTSEFAALQAIGFRATRVAGMIWGEALVLCLAGAVLGIIVAAVVFPRFEAYLGVRTVPPLVIAQALLIAVVTACVIVILPVRRLFRAEVSKSLSERTVL